MTTTPPLLRVDGLTVAYRYHQVVHDVSFALDRGRSLAIIGESGSGKSTIARALLRLLPERSRVDGTVCFVGDEVLASPERRFRPLRGRAIGYVPQDPAHALNPVRRIGAQAHEAAALLGGLDRDAQRAEILSVFGRVGLPDPQRVYDAYPHELSGGMLQRVLIGLAVLPKPALLVADEPTSALDVTVQRRILDLLQGLQRELDLGIVLITHDLAIAAERADEVLVLRDGSVQESGHTGEVFANPRSDYTRRLRSDVPSLNPDRYVATRANRATQAEATPRIELEGVCKSFGEFTAVHDMRLRVAPGTTHAIVGESGSGKTTTVRLLLGLERPDAGEIRIDGVDIVARSGAALRNTYRQLQVVYQNPFTSLDPTWTVERLVREPLDRFRVGTRAERRAAVVEAIAEVGLDASLATRRPGQLSGGQRQRVAIARTLVLRPEVIVLDEPTSALDVTVQASIFDVLVELQAKLGLTYVLVSHDLALVRQLADTVTVLRAGEIVEQGAAELVLHTPEHDYTQLLIDSIPAPLTSNAQPAARKASA
ncbi:dipeptide ABC transporter ATP-binding protein [Gulosibacter sediminis]|uniref:dipeptide ABC transporter ATP-binding protein n=1 Tax=Gulosibacter sediminis TaxID=1729695 RepID=UPI0024A8F4FA|nr:ABC transporter ATP-binding protein [Gulosibacter sediminis]